MGPVSSTSSLKHHRSGDLAARPVPVAAFAAAQVAKAAADIFGRFRTEDPRFGARMRLHPVSTRRVVQAGPRGKRQMRIASGSCQQAPVIFIWAL